MGADHEIEVKNTFDETLSIIQKINKEIILFYKLIKLIIKIIYLK